jgi:hypothetical protein
MCMFACVCIISGMSRQVLYDQITVYVVTANRQLPILDLMLPVQSRAERRQAVVNVLVWFGDLRRFFESGPFLPKLSYFLENLAWPAFRDLRLRNFAEIEETTLTDEEGSTYDLEIGETWQPFYARLPRDLSSEEFVTKVCLALMT